MAQPLFFLAGLTRATLIPGGRLSRLILAERGIADVFSDVGLGGRQDFASNELSGRGPENLSGIILAYHDPQGNVPRRVDYRPDEQEWHQIGDGVYLGVDPSDPPGPADLTRPKQYAGYAMTLADGNTWMIPVVRRPDGSSELPSDLYWDAGGQLREPIKPKYLSYWEASAEVGDWFFTLGLNAPSFEKNKALNLAVRAIGLNYRFGVAEQNVLRIVDRENFLTILAASVDTPNCESILDAQKKSSEPDSIAITTPGSTVEPQDIDQVAAN